MVKQLFLFVGVLFTVFVQFCSCKRGPSELDLKYGKILKVNKAKCDGRKYRPTIIGKSMENVCQGFFNGQEPMIENNNPTWMENLEILPEKEISVDKQSRPLYLIIPLHYNQKTNTLTPRKITP